MMSTRRCLTVGLLSFLASFLPSISSSAYAGIVPSELVELEAVPMGGYPAALALSPDGRTLYMTYTDSSGQFVRAVDTASRAEVARTAIGSGAMGSLAVSPDGGKVYLAVSKASGTWVSPLDNRIEVIDAATHRIVATVYLPGHPYGPAGIAITPDGKQVWTTHRDSLDNTVHVIDTATNTVRTIRLTSAYYVDIGPMDVAITPDSAWAYVIARSNRTVYVINTATLAIAQMITLPIGPSGAGATIAMSPDGLTAYATMSNDSRIAIIDTVTRRVVGTITTSGTALGNVGFTADGDLALVLDASNNRVLVVDTVLEAQVGAVNVGTSPAGLAMRRDGSNVIAYVSNASSKSLSLIGVRPCGNGRIDSGETCDDGNTSSGDGCSATCQLENHPPVCSGASAAPGYVWPANHQMVPVRLQGVVDVDPGDAVALRIDSIFQDEPVRGIGDGDTGPDASGVGSSNLQVRAERAGTGNGRVYHAGFTATDSHGASCSGEVTVCVPRDQGRGSACVDGGRLYDSTRP